MSPSQRVAKTHINFRVVVQKLHQPVHGANHDRRSKLFFIGYQLPYRLFRRAALRHISNLDNHLLQLAHAINVHESVQRRSAKVVVKTRWWRCPRESIDPFEFHAGSRGSISKYTKLDFEVLATYKVAELATRTELIFLYIKTHRSTAKGSVETENLHTGQNNSR